MIRHGGRFKPEAHKVAESLVKDRLLRQAEGIQLSGTALLHLEDNTRAGLMKKIIPEEHAAELERHGLIKRATGGWVTTDLGHAMLHQHGETK